MDRNASLRQSQARGHRSVLHHLPVGVRLRFLSIHPGLLAPSSAGPGRASSFRAHDAGLLQFGHVLVTLSTALLVVIAVHFMRLLDRTSWAWAGLVGGTVGILGTIILAADKGALCLTMSALDTLPASKVRPDDAGSARHVLAQGLAGVAVGHHAPAAGLCDPGRRPVEDQGHSTLAERCFLAGVLLVAFPDGAEIINLTASILMAVALIPYGMRMLVPRHLVGSALAPSLESLRQSGHSTGSSALGLPSRTT